MFVSIADRPSPDGLVWLRVSFGKRPAEVFLLFDLKERKMVGQLTGANMAIRPRPAGRFVCITEERIDNGIIGSLLGRHVTKIGKLQNGTRRREGWLLNFNRPEIGHYYWTAHTHRHVASQNGKLLIIDTFQPTGRSMRGGPPLFEVDANGSVSLEFNSGISGAWWNNTEIITHTGGFSTMDITTGVTRRLVPADALKGFVKASGWKRGIYELLLGASNGKVYLKTKFEYQPNWLAAFDVAITNLTICSTNLLPDVRGAAEVNSSGTHLLHRDRRQAWLVTNLKTGTTTTVVSPQDPFPFSRALSSTETRLSTIKKIRSHLRLGRIESYPTVSSDKRSLIPRYLAKTASPALFPPFLLFD
ncbi:MAG: hypothetical protein ACJASX_004530 [Limisphaerales bacterium]|jgi:hypothetical protein